MGPLGSEDQRPDLGPELGQVQILCSLIRSGILLLSWVSGLCLNMFRTQIDLNNQNCTLPTAYEVVCYHNHGKKMGRK